MNVRRLVPLLLLVAFAGCSESPDEKAPMEAKPAPAQGSSSQLPKKEAEAKQMQGNSLPQEAMPSASSPVPSPRMRSEPEPTAPPAQAVLVKDKQATMNSVMQVGLFEDAEEQPVAALRIAPMVPAGAIVAPPPPSLDSESYDAVKEGGFVRVASDPLSTFSIDVDTASYSNVRRFVNEGRMPPPGAVRIEEMVNYFSYSYPQPSSDQPFSVNAEIGPCPWNDRHKLARIGLKAREIDKKDLPPSNLVFLIDVSGSMADANKLPLLQQAMKLLVRQLGRNDRVSIVVYAGNDSVVLDPTPGSEQQKIQDAVDALGAGGSTHASSGIATAYRLAEQAFLPGGNNRVILASDGDFNVGVTSRDELQRLIEEKRKSGVQLTVLGFGMGNYHDDAMELLADKGNGNYAYIDSLLEAKKVLVKEMSGTLFALAKDVKIQVEFNPAKVGAYRLMGYANRALADEDFNDDRKDAGEIGVGHSVTALYELIPAGAGDLPSVDPLKYQKQTAAGSASANELMTVKLRFKPMQSEASVLLEAAIGDSDAPLAKASDDFRFAAAVAGYGMLLVGSEHAGNLTWMQVVQLAQGARGQDMEGYRAEFVRLAEATELLAQASAKTMQLPQESN